MPMALSMSRSRRAPSRSLGRTILAGLCFAGLALGGAPTARAFDGVTTLAGLSEQAALASRLHQRLAERFSCSLGLFEPLRLELSLLESRRAGDLYGRLLSLDPGQGYAPEWRERVPGRTHPPARLSAIGWLAAGSVLETTPAWRVRNHFFDPRTQRGLSRGPGETVATASLQATAAGLSNVRDLFAGAAVDGTGIAAPEWVLSSQNELGRSAFLRAYERAVLAKDAAERESALADALLDVGAMAAVLAQLGDPAHVDNRLEVVLDGSFRTAVAERFGRAGVPAPAPIAEKTLPPRKLTELFFDGRGSGLSEQTVKHFHGTAAAAERKSPVDREEALLPVIGQYAQRLVDYLFRGDLRLRLTEGQKSLVVSALDTPFGGGTVVLLGEEPEGSRKVLRKQMVVPTRAFGKLISFELTPEELRATHRLVVFYAGRDLENEPLVTSAQILVPGTSSKAPVEQTDEGAGAAESVGTNVESR